jgi:hypothetical protein
MKYFRLTHSIAPETIGSEYPQIQKMTKGYDYDKPNSVHAASRFYDSFLPFEPDLDSMVLHPKAKLTDILSCSVLGSNGFIISEKVYNICNLFQSVPAHYYPVKVLEKNRKMHQYYWMHIVTPDAYKLIDIKASSFHLEDLGRDVGKIHVTSLEDLVEKRTAEKKRTNNYFLTISCDRFLVNNLLYQYAIFQFGKFDSFYYVREDLKNALEDIPGIGVDFTLANIYLET